MRRRCRRILNFHCRRTNAKAKLRHSFQAKCDETKRKEARAVESAIVDDVVCERVMYIANEALCEGAQRRKTLRMQITTISVGAKTK